jgi:hypothetical protein
VIPSPGSPATDQLKIEIYDKDKKVDLVKNDHIGLYDPFWIHSLPRNPSSPTEVVLDLTRTDKKGKVKSGSMPGDAGELTLTFELVPLPGSPPFPATVYRALIEFQSAANIPAGDANGKSDPYLEARLAHSENSQKFKSRTIKGTLSPEWRQQALFYFCSLEKDVLDIVLFDEDTIGDNDTLAKVSVPLSDFPIDGELTEKTYSLVTPEKKGKPAGTILILGKLKIVPSAGASAPRPAPKPAAIPEPAAALPAQAGEVVIVTREVEVDGEHCQFSWGNYGSEYSTNFSSWKDYGKRISTASLERGDFHQHPERPVKKVKDTS